MQTYYARWQLPLKVRIVILISLYIFFSLLLGDACEYYSTALEKYSVAENIEALFKLARNLKHQVKIPSIKKYLINIQYRTDGKSEINY
jgi:hypothetical protein